MTEIRNVFASRLTEAWLKSAPERTRDVQGLACNSRNRHFQSKLPFPRGSEHVIADVQ